jgi:hypothetical protein
VSAAFKKVIMVPDINMFSQFSFIFPFSSLIKAKLFSKLNDKIERIKKLD